MKFATKEEKEIGDCGAGTEGQTPEERAGVFNFPKWSLYSSSCFPLRSSCQEPWKQLMFSHKYILFFTYLVYPLPWAPVSSTAKVRRGTLNNLAQWKVASPPTEAQSPFGQETQVSDSEYPSWQGSDQRHLWGLKTTWADGLSIPIYSDPIAR